MSDWTTQAADTIDKTVAAVRDRTVVPVTKAVNVVVFGVLAAICVLVALLLLAIVGFRILDLAVPTWAAWMILGGILGVGGLFCWTRRLGGSNA
jgi:hypothetical protein